MIIRHIKADLMRLKGTGFGLIHILIPLLMVTVFIAYYSFAGWSQENQIVGFFSCLGIGLPVIVALLCTIVTDQELGAGVYQQMLTTPDRITSFSSKLIIMTVCGAAAVFATALLFGLGNCYLLGHNIVNMKYYVSAGGAFLLECVVLYTLHLFLAFVFSKGVTIMLGLVEGLLSALLQTSLGDSSWQWVPCEWGTRLMHNYLLRLIYGKDMETGCNTALINCIVMSIVVLVLYIIWCRRWEGTHTE